MIDMQPKSNTNLTDGLMLGRKSHGMVSWIRARMMKDFGFGRRTVYHFITVTDPSRFKQHVSRA
jgi:hypothetical protein